ncbi:MAG: ferredoxin [Candidatus Saganbacteria bacterium]|nr:ferredoxin [Candidatus Saganbacteria bacterium]
MAITKITIEDGCTGCGLCEQIAEGIFEIPSDVAVVKAGADLNANEAKIKEAADSCPVTCIKVA